MCQSPSFVSRQQWTAAVVVSIGVLVATGIAASAANPAQEKGSPKSVWDKVYTEAQATRGKEIYRQECSGCHLDSLGGAEMASALAGEAFLTSWNELSVGDLFERTRISMPQDGPARLTRQAYIDVIAHILQVNNFPAGQNELGHDLAVLKEIKILSKPPGQK